MKNKILISALTLSTLLLVFVATNKSFAETDSSWWENILKNVWGNKTTDIKINNESKKEIKGKVVDSRTLELNKIVDDLKKDKTKQGYASDLLDKSDLDSKDAIALEKKINEIKGSSENPNFTPSTPNSSGSGGGSGNESGQQQNSQQDSKEPSAAQQLGVLNNNQTGGSGEDIAAKSNIRISAACRANWGMTFSGSCGSVAGLNIKVKQAAMEACTIAGKPIPVNSAYRDSVCNKKVKGAGGSMHMSRLALDINAGALGDKAKDVWIVFKKNNFKGIGCYNPNTVHLDLRSSDARWGPDFKSGSFKPANCPKYLLEVFNGSSGKSTPTS